MSTRSATYGATRSCSPAGGWRRWTPSGALSALLPPGVHSGFDYRMDAIPAVGVPHEAILRELGRDDAAIARLRLPRPFDGRAGRPEKSLPECCYNLRLRECSSVG